VAVTKRSISFDPGLLAEAERVAAARHGGNLSALVNDALESRLRHERLGVLLDDIEREAGPLAEEQIAAADAELAAWESRSTQAR
jgi:hypothetical protein